MPARPANSPSLDPADRSRLRVGLAGCGAIARRYHLPALSSDSGVERIVVHQRSAGFVVRPSTHASGSSRGPTFVSSTELWGKPCRLARPPSAWRPSSTCASPFSRCESIRDLGGPQRRQGSHGFGELLAGHRRLPPRAPDSRAQSATDPQAGDSEDTASPDASKCDRIRRYAAFVKLGWKASVSSSSPEMAELAALGMLAHSARKAVS